VEVVSETVEVSATPDGGVQVTDTVDVVEAVVMSDGQVEAVEVIETARRTLVLGAGPGVVRLLVGKVRTLRRPEVREIQVLRAQREPGPQGEILPPEAIRAITTGEAVLEQGLRAQQQGSGAVEPQDMGECTGRLQHYCAAWGVGKCYSRCFSEMPRLQWGFYPLLPRCGFLGFRLHRHQSPFL
jgi:hypothetical protein